MAEQAIDELRAIVSRLREGTYLRLLPSAFSRYFGEGVRGRMAAYEFATDNDCTVEVEEKDDLLGAKFTRK
jgi:hypothetical protein